MAHNLSPWLKMFQKGSYFKFSQQKYHFRYLITSNIFLEGRNCFPCIIRSEFRCIIEAVNCKPCRSEKITSISNYQSYNFYLETNGAFAAIAARFWSTLLQYTRQINTRRAHIFEKDGQFSWMLTEAVTIFLNVEREQCPFNNSRWTQPAYIRVS